MGEFCDLPTNLLDDLPKLQVLKLTDGQDDLYDLSGVTQLTALNILQRLEPSVLRGSILPSDNAVRLQSLSLAFQSSNCMGFSTWRQPPGYKV